MIYIAQIIPKLLVIFIISLFGYLLNKHLSLEDDAYSCLSVKKSLIRDRRLFETRR